MMGSNVPLALAKRFPDDRSAYTDGKSSFVARVLEAHTPFRR